MAEFGKMMRICIISILIVVLHSNLAYGKSVCPKVTVRHSPHKEGKYFYFLPYEFTQMVGTDRWAGKEYEIIQDGSNSWTGKVKVWDVNMGQGGYGYKSNGKAEGDWKKGDTITLKACSEAE